MPNTPKRSAGRPKAIIDWDKVGKMLEAGATAEGIAATIGCDRDTLYNRCKSDLNQDFSAFSQERKAKGDELLRAKQFQVAMSGDKTMLVWLGKNRLKQTDKHAIEHTGAGGAPISIIIQGVAGADKPDD
jgi:hypothetical protein